MLGSKMMSVPTKTATRCLFLLLTACIVNAAPAWAAHRVTDYGAMGDGKTKDTGAVQRAIDACAGEGGGTVYFPAGIYLCGSLHLRDGVTLSLDNGATIKGSPHDADYDPYEELGFENDADEETAYFHHSLIWGEDVERVAIVGQGTIDSNRLARRGPKSIALKRCRHVTIRDVTILNAPNYAISLLGTDYVAIDGVTILNAFADGIDPDASRNVRISNCHIESWDDAIVPKASFSLGERRPSENITVTNCYLSTACNAFKLGTESGGDFKRIAISNCVMAGLKGRRPASGGICVESVDGSNIDGVVASNITMVDVRAPIFIRLGNRGRDMETPEPGTLRNIAISNIVATNASNTCTITGIPGHPVEGVLLDGVRIAYRGGCPYRPPGEPVPENIDAYPDPGVFGALPAYGFYCRHATDLTFDDVHVTYADEFWRLTGTSRPEWDTESAVPRPSEPGRPGHALWFDDVTDLRIEGLCARPSRMEDPVIRLNDVRDAWISGARLTETAAVFLEVSGGRSERIALAGNFLWRAKGLTSIAPEVPPETLIITHNLP